MKVKTREYKVMLRAELFVNPKQDIALFIKELAERTGAEGDLLAPEKKTIHFLDTPDFNLLRNGLVLRQRDLVDENETQITLKCRSRDRYIAQGKDLSAGQKLKGKSKLEEDIAAPFRSRFSQSTTVKFVPKELPSLKTIKAAGELFPILLDLPRDGQICSSSTKLSVVNDVVAHERVYKGFSMMIAEKEASIAVILWTKGFKGRPLAAEFYFRYGDSKEVYPASLADSAREVFSRIQQLDWCDPSIPTKTQYVYRENRS